MSPDQPSPNQPAGMMSGIGSLLLKILLVLLIAVGVFAGYVASKPDDYRVERSMTMAASPEIIFQQVNNLRQWNDWSPWAKLDPNAQNSFSGPESGEGAAFTWSGNDKIGVGTMTITQSRPSDLVEYRLDFQKPMQDTGMSEFRLLPQGDQTKVTWAMFGTYQNFAQKAICTVMNMDKMLGPQFEEGLANLKKVVEASPTKQPSTESTTTASEES